MCLLIKKRIMIDLNEGKLTINEREAETIC